MYLRTYLKSWPRALCLSLCLFVFGGLAAGHAGEIEYRLLLQVSEDNASRLNLALNNARNAQSAFGADNIEIEIVVFGPGIHTLTDFAPAYMADKVKKAGESGVRIVACENSMRAFELSAEELLPEVEYVASGVAELIEKQAKGWTYIRP
uniref:DsrE/DsrF-like family protein n=1 Tax=Candidatus Kentrum sp. MB TaxID=2138164 RepID=A0A450Y2Z1_9GAMM|nr:MAG: hypothetical protein BECKMB1821G_GA0114241_11385 [Candidatus Kentron sp. MB]VFK35822.1 MAG: hypothetical protein BECKMB1821I_GA0114274_11495 [Candidatus Kentron sp. MB]VFK77519.1 MAG: hypothetical protein BECKMB1821H_GA0114242_11534 [Candidatus Kentron sp. MB]